MCIASYRYSYPPTASAAAAAEPNTVFCALLRDDAFASVIRAQQIHSAPHSPVSSTITGSELSLQFCASMVDGDCNEIRVEEVAAVELMVKTGRTVERGGLSEFLSKFIDSSRPSSVVSILLVSSFSSPWLLARDFMFIPPPYDAPKAPPPSLASLLECLRPGWDLTPFSEEVTKTSRQNTY